MTRPSSVPHGLEVDRVPTDCHLSYVGHLQRDERLSIIRRWDLFSGLSIDRHPRLP